MPTRLTLAVLALLCCGTPPTAKVSSLTVEQTRQWCRERTARFETRYSVAERKNLTCNIEGLVLPSLLSFNTGQPLSPAERVRACEDQLTQCTGTTQRCDTATVDPSCNATVEDIESCFEAQLVALESLMKGPRCDLADSDGGPGLVLPSCPRLDARCPGKGVLFP